MKIRNLFSTNFFRQFKGKTNKIKVIKETMLLLLRDTRDEFIYIIKNPNPNIRKIDKNVKGHLGLCEAKILYRFAKKSQIAL